MKGRSILLTISAITILLFSAAGNAHAMSAYARNFNMKCSECHKPRIPELNEFGIAFYKNGFALPGKDQEKPPADKAAPPSAGAPPSDVPTKKSADTGSAPDQKTEEAPEGKPAEGRTAPDGKAEESKPVPPPEVPLVIYKGQAGDGSVYFTDNPLSRRRLLEKGQKEVPPVAKSLPARKAVKNGDATPRKSESSKKHRNYQECMERQLENAPAGSSQQMMELFMEAERSCAGYPSRTP